MTARDADAGAVPDRAALKAAAEWYAHLRSGMATDADREAWRRWREQAPDHGRAWERVEALQQRFQILPARLSRTTLTLAADGPAGTGRRAVLKGVVAAFTAGAAAWIAEEALPWPAWLAGHRTSTGESRDLRLADGTRLLLNTASAVDVDYGGDARLVTLHDGEILVETAADTAVPPRPFLVRTAHGRIRALGTRFTVRADAAGTRVAVLQDAVEITAGPTRAVLRAGQRARFTAASLEPPDRLDDAETSWTAGVLIVSDWRLDELLAELGRYRPGRLGCDPGAAGLRVSGAFPLHDTDRALAALEQSLPVRVVRRTRFWVSVEPR